MSSVCIVDDAFLSESTPSSGFTGVSKIHISQIHIDQSLGCRFSIMDISSLTISVCSDTRYSRTTALWNKKGNGAIFGPGSKNQPSALNTMLWYHILTSIQMCRHSIPLSYVAWLSVFKERNLWLRHSKSIQYYEWYDWILLNDLNHVTQTLSTLILCSNDLGAEGTKYLINALKFNQVSWTM